MYLAILAAVLLVLVLSLSTTNERIAKKLLLYVRVARLYTKQPDRTVAMPLLEVSKSRVSDTWHAPRGADRLHEGQDIFAPRGTPIYSATSGYVYNIGENNLGGHTITVIGAGGRIYYYAHLDAYAPTLVEGDHVTTSTVLGYVGTSGNAAGTPPHLHFGIYSSAGAINPLPLLRDRLPAPVLNNKPPTSLPSAPQTRKREASN